MSCIIQYNSRNKVSKLRIIHDSINRRQIVLPVLEQFLSLCQSRKIIILFDEFELRLKLITQYYGSWSTKLGCFFCHLTHHIQFIRPFYSQLTVSLLVHLSSVSPPCKHIKYSAHFHGNEHTCLFSHRQHQNNTTKNINDTISPVNT